MIDILYKYHRHKTPLINRKMSLIKVQYKDLNNIIAYRKFIRKSRHEMITILLQGQK